MSTPMKRAGFAQGLYAQSEHAKEAIGTLRVLHDGTKWRYCRAGANALTVGRAVMAAAVANGVTDQNCASAHAIGDTQVTETITAGVAYAENYFAGGWLHINDATGEGYAYPIQSSTAVGIAGTSITVTLTRPIVVATVAVTTQFSLAHNPCMAVVHSTAGTGAGKMVGVTARAVTAQYYFWAQTAGPAIVLADGTPAVGVMLMPGTISGSLAAYAAASTWAVVGHVWGRAFVDTEYKMANLTLD